MKFLIKPYLNLIIKLNLKLIKRLMEYGKLIIHRKKDIKKHLRNFLNIFNKERDKSQK
jgi:hypothetical protein